MTGKLAALVLAAVLAAAPAAAAAAAPTVIADGHVDMGPRMVGGAWTIQLRDDTTRPATWRPLSDVVLQAGSASKMAVPPGPEYAFLGAPGAPVWLLPQVQRPGVLWPGWNTQDPSIAALVTREVTWRLHAVGGPGRFSLFLNGSFGKPEEVFDSGRPFPQETGIEAASHVHGNWAFSAPGGYTLDVEMRTAAAGGTTLSDRQQLRIHVGDGDPAGAFLPPPTSGTPAAPRAVVAPREDDAANHGWWYLAGGVVVAGALAVALKARRGRSGS
ncbi:TIGR03773 family transporter-associated surface protein [Amycolatopsis sp. A133]|uniref:TIGR03773 family transporter-associated surface protein n=1 Tax=Amycolatopsis sp. A133 TaxID=3064472 RepID=UPI0027F5232F|nr:TIGR03773 family transporter-associated surface protein [Amycolatopsis sp. A133]MDQ7810926.1 TIGR03773 family transporter-associated surface protein [Amycolatopsis sp. A133]